MAKEEKKKKIDIPNLAKAEIAQMNQTFNTYVSGLAVGMGIKGKWAFDAEKKQFIVDKEE